MGIYKTVHVQSIGISQQSDTIAIARVYLDKCHKLPILILPCQAEKFPSKDGVEGCSNITEMACVRAFMHEGIQ